MPNNKSQFIDGEEVVIKVKNPDFSFFNGMSGVVIESDVKNKTIKVKFLRPIKVDFFGNGQKQLYEEFHFRPVDLKRAEMEGQKRKPTPKPKTKKTSRTSYW